MSIPEITVDAIVLGTLYASALVFVGCVVVMAFTVVSCALPSGCPTPRRSASGFQRTPIKSPRVPAVNRVEGTLTDENYR